VVQLSRRSRAGRGAAWSAHLLWSSPKNARCEAAFPQDRRDRSPSNQVLSVTLGGCRSSPNGHRLARYRRYAECMRVRDLLAELQRLPRDLEVLAFEAGCEDYCEREVDELELQGGRVYLHLGARRDEPRR
jgi:hypothetical protein